MDDLNADIFERRIGKDVHVQGDDAVVTMRVVQVERRATNAPPQPEGALQVRAEGFSVVLKGPLDPVLAPLTYPVDVPDGGQHFLFVSQFAQDAEAAHYEIVVN
ncbi:DUF6916 family protein [Pseudaestuariivita atlantica]|uniref:DUF6916 domain-containing protein n=1 Tax=Pseudaestuariivita atlantica TaxID=1317121 RepID=A0A0L1JMG8_9RHOB|nr:hypothetical protein [Pseudaestuariivita atlantica]KNG92939.1 hypothetical protein ATO11_13455 [Pseudaestuariivita atlantica]